MGHTDFGRGSCNQFSITVNPCLLPESEGRPGSCNEEPVVLTPPKCLPEEALVFLGKAPSLGFGPGQ